MTLESLAVTNGPPGERPMIDVAPGPVNDSMGQAKDFNEAIGIGRPQIEDSAIDCPRSRRLAKDGLKKWFVKDLRTC